VGHPTEHTTFKCERALRLKIFIVTKSCSILGIGNGFSGLLFNSVLSTAKMIALKMSEVGATCFVRSRDGTVCLPSWFSWWRHFPF